MPRAADCGPRERCAASTCALGPGPAAGPGGKSRSNTEPAHLGPGAASCNSPVADKREQIFFSCVTTRRSSTVAELALADSALAPHGPGPAVGVAAARRPPAAGVLPPEGDAVVGAASSASGEPSAGTSAAGNTADSNAAAGRHARSPCADKRGAPADACWRKLNDGWYTGGVPWEPHSQRGRPSGSPKPLGHFLSGHSGSGPHRSLLSTPVRAATPPVL